MSQEELLTRVVRLLEDQAVPYFLTGSLASSMQGEPRASHDIDFVVEGTSPMIDALVREFHDARYYLDPEAARAALSGRASFNLVDSTEAIKVDFWMADGRPFDASRMSRRVRMSGSTGSCWVSSPEDTILIKLKWMGLAGQSERQFTDALRVYEVRARTLDHGYLELWVEHLGLQGPWQRLKAEARPL